MEVKPISIDRHPRRSLRKTHDIPIRKFDFPIKREGDYAFPDRPAESHFLHILSLFFPEGERFFVDSVMNYRDQIKDEKLRQQIRGFAGQEAQHAKQHAKYNDRIAKPRIRTDWLDPVQDVLFKLARKLPKKVQLAATVGAEHFTALLADKVLRHPEIVKGSNPDHQALWMWHAAEETEHKAVAFDVYRAIGGGYVIRVATMTALSTALVPGIAGMMIYFMAADEKLFSFKDWRSFGQWAFGEGGMFSDFVGPFVAFYRPGFHPWQQDNSALLEKWKGLQGNQTSAQA
ncbi:MAG: metal-dependent hydrolase [Deltaproteobacteria bacterium]|nr:metal-dependent hydrolase [Deltaproteobacteria bacterium]